MTLLERQRAARMMKSQQDHQQLQPQQQHQHQQSYFFASSGFNEAFSSMIANGSFLGELVPQPMEPNPVLENGWAELSKFDMSTVEFGSSGFDVNSAISTPSCCPSSEAAVAAVTDSNGRESVISSEKLSSASGRQSFKKRKAGKAQNPKVVAENENKDKRIKVCAEEAGESKITEQTSSKNNSTTSNKNNRETSAGNSKENSKASEVPKPDYIHVRARRGQATDSHSLAERVRREKISERMKYLQDLVPGCNKITGKAGMLDEIINYVQSLQKQVEFLSMKLAAVNPSLDFNIDDLFSKGMCPPFAPSFPATGMSTDMTNTAYLQFNSAQQMASYSGLDMGINRSDVGLRRSISGAVSMPEMFIDSSCFAQQTLPSTTWEADLQNLYNVGFDQARSTSSFPSQPFTCS